MRCATLGSCLVVKNLGVQVLLGEPAKKRHNVVTWPKAKKMSFEDVKGNLHTCSTLQNNLGAELCRFLE